MSALIIAPEDTHHLVLGVDAVVHDGKQPGGALQRVGAAGLEVQRAQAPVLQLTWQMRIRKIKDFEFDLCKIKYILGQYALKQLTKEVSGTNSLSEVELAFAVEAQDVLKYPGRPIKVEFPPL